MAKRQYSHPQRVLHGVWFTAAFFRFHYLLFFLMSSSGCTGLLIILLFSSIIPSIKCFRKQFLSNPVSIPFLLFVRHTLLLDSLYIKRWKPFDLNCITPSPLSSSNLTPLSRYSSTKQLRGVLGCVNVVCYIIPRFK